MKDVPGRARARPRARRGVDARGPVGCAVRARSRSPSTTLPQGAKVGTSSMRRQCQLLARPSRSRRSRCCAATCRRGSSKLDDGEFDAIVLAAAGLTRLGMADRITQMLPLELSIPAVAQGVLGLETRGRDVSTDRADPPRDRTIPPRSAASPPSAAFLARMGGSCQTPLAAHAIGSRRRRHAARRHVRHARRLEDPARRDRGAADDAELLGVRARRAICSRRAPTAILAATAE